MGQGLAEVLQESTQPTREQLAFFETKIRPVLIRECYGCHSQQSGQSKGGLRLDSRTALRNGGDSGPAVVPGDLESSLLFGAITHTDMVMPPRSKLDDTEIADFRRWILDGAADPRVSAPIEQPQVTIDDQTIARAKATFWAYQPPQRIAPQVATPTASGLSKDWSLSPIDDYVLVDLIKAGIRPADDASAETLVRRLYFDLVGLPPSPSQTAAFVSAFGKDPEAAVAEVVDRLLDASQFGEHWGRHWLDVVRYAESTGREVNMTYPNAYRYRDYVIDAFNDDKPYDQFVQEQLAGDLLPARDDAEWSRQLIATSFLAVGTKNVNEQSAAQFLSDLADEQIDVTTRVFLGTSVACARCHDHKFDPIRQSDYYALAGIFQSTKTFFGNPPSQYGSFGGPQIRQTSSLLLLPQPDAHPIGRSYTPDELSDLHRQVQSRLDQLSELRRGGLQTRAGASSAQMRIRLSNELASLSAKLSVVDQEGVPRSYCMGVQDRQTVADVPLLVRGEIDQRAQRVPRGLPKVFASALTIPSDSSGRLELARWIGSDQNPLAARVMVNRIWHHVFGQGLVPTTEDFGMTGAAPSHPELLDHLAIEFVNSGWSVKTMVRQLMTTRAYRMASTFDRANHQLDPDNRLLWRSNVKRLNAEAIRDAMLAVAGSLQTEPPQASVVADAGYLRVRAGTLEDPREAARRSFERALASRREQMQRMRRGGGRPDFSRRNPMSPLRDAPVPERQDMSLDRVDADYRSVYLPVVRDFVPRSLEVFDFADPNLITGVREASNTSNQALFLLNNPLTLRCSEAFAERLAAESDGVDERIEHAFQLAYGRGPSAGEAAASRAYLRQSGLDEAQTLAAFCQSLFAAAEFRYLY
ncbi:DUF1553 domain-containing protein [Roseiconus nitratireducens]|uniref:DUF1553 domain-containing protein n=2 Tax=Roseiconus nitratireducens TaxID=2605748 RepID=A0A5M6D0V9_9BACT|nr:DUF1553 domain-containing protein [Roseiconus nitratireducens]